MIDNLKKILNEDQDPKAIEKITAKLENLLMSNEEVGYIAVQKKPAVTIFPDSIVVTNKRIILCKPKNLGLSMEFIDYDWDDIAGSFVKEGILGVLKLRWLSIFKNYRKKVTNTVYTESVSFQQQMMLEQK